MLYLCVLFCKKETMSSKKIEIPRKKVVFFLAALMWCCVSFAVPARRGWEQHFSTDGTSVELQQQGDECYHYWETRDGKLALPLGNNLFELTDANTPTPAQVAARRAGSPYYTRDARKIGAINMAPRGLVILVAYADLPYCAENTQSAIDSMMNHPGYSYNGATGSARDYFIAQSDSQYRPVFDVVGPVTLPHNRAYYGANNSAGSDQNPAQMTVDACRLVDGEVDFTRYDNNNDGEIDFVYVLFAGIGENDRNGEAEAIWPHNFYAGSKNCWLDGKKLNNYACSGEVDGLTGLRNGIGTLCHEFSHVLGLPDYYDTSSSGYNSTHILTPNDWSIMDYGCYNNGGNTPPNYSIFDKYFLGWATPALLAEGAQLNVSLGTGYDEGYQINGGTTLLPYSTINGFSKSYAMTGFRVGYLAGPHDLIAPMVKIHQYCIMCAPTTSQYAAIEAIKNGDEDVLMMRESYDERRRIVVHLLREMGLPAFEPLGAFYVFPCIKEFGMSSEEFATRLLEEEEVAIVPGAAFGDSGEGFLRISYAYSIENLKEALSRLERFVTKLRQSN